MIREDREAPDATADTAVADFLRQQMQGIAQAARQVFGIPDYGRYLAHAQATHPERPVMSEREFHAFAIDRRYGGMGPRCC